MLSVRDDNSSRYVQVAREWTAITRLGTLQYWLLQTTVSTKENTFPHIMRHFLTYWLVQGWKRKENYLSFYYIFYRLKNIRDLFFTVSFNYVKLLLVSIQLRKTMAICKYQVILPTLNYLHYWTALNRIVADPNCNGMCWI